MMAPVKISPSALSCSATQDSRERVTIVATVVALHLAVLYFAMTQMQHAPTPVREIRITVEAPEKPVVLPTKPVPPRVAHSKPPKRKPAKAAQPKKLPKPAPVTTETPRIDLEREAARLKAEQEAAQVRAANEAAQAKARTEAARLKAEQEAAQVRAANEAAQAKARTEAARLKAEQEAAQVRAANEAAQAKARTEAARLKAEQEAAQVRAANEATISFAAEEGPPQVQVGGYGPTNKAPSYPHMARRMGLQGKVVLNVEVLANGSCGQINIAQSSGHAALDNNALSAVKTWHFIPATQAGKAINKWHQVPIIFSLKDS
jgi:protein TonB